MPRTYIVDRQQLKRCGQMGYAISNLVRLPFRADVSLYIYAIGDGLWEGAFDELIQKNFQSIAKAIGPDAIIVQGLSDEFHGEVVKKYFGSHHRELKSELPGFLLTDSHPEEFSAESFVFLIPFEKMKSHYVLMDEFFRDLVAFARGEDRTLLDVLEESSSGGIGVDEIIKFNLPIIPGVLVVNGNAALRFLRKMFGASVDA